MQSAPLVVAFVKGRGAGMRLGEDGCDFTFFFS
jgi:hypothetical protein